jgi:hypothetical protein
MNLEKLLEKQNIPNKMKSIGWEYKLNKEKFIFEKTKGNTKGLIYLENTEKGYTTACGIAQNKKIKTIKRYLSKTPMPVINWMIRFASINEKYF